MWLYQKKLEYPVNITKKDLKMAKYLAAQYGGPDGELAASLRYINQRYTMPDEKGRALLTDIGTEEYDFIRCLFLYRCIELKKTSHKDWSICTISAGVLEYDYYNTIFLFVKFTLHNMDLP